MITDVDLGGVYVDGLLIWAVVALVICAVLHRLFEALGVYRVVWHRALFDLAIYTIVLGLLALNGPWTLLR
jgi:hypothetical protein